MRKPKERIRNRIVEQCLPPLSFAHPSGDHIRDVRLPAPNTLEKEER